MQRNYIFPIRFKLLLTMLVFITAVVSAIVFTMANLFHADKAAYIRGLTAEMATHRASEARTMLNGYHSQLKIFSHVILNMELLQEQKSDLIKKLFIDFPQFIAVSVYENDQEVAAIYDSLAFKEDGARKDALKHYRKEHPFALERMDNEQACIENTTYETDFPILTIAMRSLNPVNAREVVVAAVVRLDDLVRLVRRSNVFDGFIVDHNGIPLAHQDIQKVLLKTPVNWMVDAHIQTSRQSPVLSLEFDRNGIPMVGAIAQLGFSDLLAGVEIPLSAAFLTSKELLRRLAMVSLLILVISALLSLVWSHYLTRSLGRLTKAARRIGQGHFDIQVEVPSRDEIGELSGSFNRMANELNSREAALKNAQSALIQSEKMAAFGQIGAGIAHEVKNPLAGILGLTQLCLRKVEKESLLASNLNFIEKETRRCKAIIENLLRFARQEKMVFGKIDINQVVNDTATMMSHQLGIHQIKLEKTFASGMPDARGNANQLQQVLMNLIINGQQAMEGRTGSIMLSTSCVDGKNVNICVRDSGPGIAPEQRTKIFEPFYTTKPIGEGTGLGLSVSYGIIKEHQGDIRVSEDYAEGAEFQISIPVWIDHTEAETLSGIPAKQ